MFYISENKVAVLQTPHQTLPIPPEKTGNPTPLTPPTLLGRVLCTILATISWEGYSTYKLYPITV